MSKFNELKSEHDRLISDLQNGAMTGDDACTAINDYLSEILDFLGYDDGTIMAKAGDKNGTEKI